MTNLDKIRNMPAEDFAEYLINFNRCSKCVHYNKEEFECGYLETPVPCIDGVTKWLEQESNPMPEIKIGDIIYATNKDHDNMTMVCVHDGPPVKRLFWTEEGKTMPFLLLKDGEIRKIYRYNTDEHILSLIWRRE